MREMKKLSMYEDSVRKAIDFLVSCQKENGAISDRGASAFDIWETVNSLQAIMLGKSYSAICIEVTVNKAFQFCESVEDERGLLIHGTYLSGCVCIETSSEYCNLLGYVGKTCAANRRLSEIELLVDEGGYWRVLNPEVKSLLQSFPSATGYALRAFLKCMYNTRKEDEALNYLLESQNEEGHWGSEWEFYGTPFYAMDPILYVLRYHDRLYNCRMALKKATAYIVQNQHRDGCWKIGNDTKITANRVLQTALALQSMINVEGNGVDESFSKGVKWLIGNQKANGSWNGGVFPHPDPKKRKREDIYVTSQITRLFCQLMLSKRRIYFERIGFRS